MYNLTLINLLTLCSTQLLESPSKSIAIAKIVTYLTDLGLDEDDVKISHRDGTYCIMFYHPVLNTLYVLRLYKII